MSRQLRCLWLVIGYFLLSSCIHQAGENQPSDVGLNKTFEPSQQKEAQQQIGGDANSQLNKEVLQKLLLTHFAFIEQDWDLAVSSAVDAAQLSDDWRIYEKPARAAIALKDYESARQLSSSWMKKKPDSELAMLIYIASQVGLGQTKQALTIANKFVDKNSETAYDLLSQYLRLQSNAAAVDLMKELHAENAQSPSFLFNAALVAVWFRQTNSAEKWINEALLVKADFEPAILLKYELFKVNHGLLVAIDYLQVHARQLNEAYSVRYTLLSEWYQQGRYQLVLSFAANIDFKNPKNVELASLLAQSHVQLENYSTAKVVLKELLVVSPGFDQAKFRLGWLSFFSNDYSEAIKWFSAVSSNAEFYFESNMKIAQALASQTPGEIGMQRALRQLNLVESLTRKQFVRHAEVRDDILQENKRYLRAFGYANEALVNYPNAPELLYRRAMSAIYIDEIATVESDLKRVLSLQPNNATVLNTLGYVLVENTTRYDEARIYIEKALAIEPESYHILDSMGWVLFKLGDFEQSQNFLERAYAADQHPDISAHLGEVLFVQGEVLKAKKLLRKATEKHSDNEVIIDTIKRLGLEES